MTVRQRGGSWEAALVVKGARYRKSLPTREAAELWEAQTKASLLSGTGPEKAPRAEGSGDAPATLSDLRDRTVDRYWKGTRGERSAVINAEIVVQVLGPNTRPRDVSIASVDRLIKVLGDKGNAPATVNRKLAALSKMLRLAHSRGWVPAIPRIERLEEGVGRIRYIAPAEEAKALAWLRWAALTEMADLFTFLTDTGVRVGEAIRLEWRDVDLANRAIRVWETKGDLPRSVPLTGRLVTLLLSRQRPDGTVFSTDHQAIRKDWQRLRVYMGLVGDAQFVPHCLRHTCASRLVQSGISILVVKDWLGHKTLEMTLRYAHLAPSNLAAARDALDRLQGDAGKVA